MFDNLSLRFISYFFFCFNCFFYLIKPSFKFFFIFVFTTTYLHFMCIYSIS
jgi:hypothetical protein